VVDFRTRYLPSTSLITASANLFRPSIPSHWGIQLRHRININIFKTSWEMGAARNTFGAIALWLSLDAKIVNNFQTNIQYFNTHYNIAQYLSNRVTISRYRKWLILNCFFSHRSNLIKNTETVIKNVFSTSAHTSQRSLPQWQCRTQSKSTMSEDIYMRLCILYVTWKHWNHREARLTENIGKRISMLAVAPVW
jgi:hypothetical protein